MLKSHKKTILEALGRNPVHPFPARMAPGIALDVLSEHKSTRRVLDPMAGSGTVLAVARAEGHRAFGYDLDPLSVLLATVWTRTIDAELVAEKAISVLQRAKKAFANLATRDAYPWGSDDESKCFIRYWFDEYTRRQLVTLSAAIKRVHDVPTRDVLWCGFSRLIITKCAGASLAMDLSHSRPHRVFKKAPVKPFNQFLAAVQAVIANCPSPDMRSLGPPATMRLGDARNLATEDESIDLVLTSPPYLNAIDYMRCSKFSLVWMGHNVDHLRSIRRASVGSEASSRDALEAKGVQSLIKELRLRPELSKRDNGLLAQYVWDMGKSLAEVSRVLRKHGRAVYVVGDSTVRGTFIRNSRVVEAVAEEHGLSLNARHERRLPANRRYLPPPKRNKNAKMDARMGREVVLIFDKAA